jgi:acetyltransferase-like isoleucine patch superfamily enzyme/lysophospholipase L1-like esterase
MNYIESLYEKFGDRVDIHQTCSIDPDVRIEIEPGGRLIMEEKVSIMRGTSISIMKNAVVKLRKNVIICENVVIGIMCYLDVGEGCGISNMTEIHDYNHRDRSFEVLGTENEIGAETSGFESAPTILESGVVISNKVSILAGVRIGQNSKIGANSVVSRSITPNSVAVGIPAKVVRHFEGPLNNRQPARKLIFGFYGTSIMQHYQAYSSKMYDQMNIPKIGSCIEIESWEKRGYVAHLAHLFQTELPDKETEVKNYAEGGATSRELLKIVEANVDKNERANLAIIGCGLNDVWRKFEGRMSEAVELEEFRDNFRQMLKLLQGVADSICIVNETPFATENADMMNAELKRYNRATFELARERKIHYVDVYGEFQRVNASLWGTKRDKYNSLWTDGVHLSDLGDHLMCKTILEYFKQNKIFSTLCTYKRYESNLALQIYASEME